MSMNTENEAKIALGAGEEAVEVEKGNIMEFHLDENSAVKRQDTVFSFHDMPYKNQAPHGILTRWREIDSLAVTGIGANVVSTLQVLLDDPVIVAALKSFIYFRTDIEVRFLSVTTPMAYGRYYIAPIQLLGYQPGAVVGIGTFQEGDSWFSDLGGPMNGCFRAVNNGSCICDVSEQVDVTYTLKWPSPAEYMNLISYYSTSDPRHIVTQFFAKVAFRMAIFGDRAFSALSTGNTTIVPIRVYARMVNPITQGFIPNNVVDEGMRKAGYSLSDAHMFQSAAGLSAACMSNEQCREFVKATQGYIQKQASNAMSEAFRMGSEYFNPTSEAHQEEIHSESKNEIAVHNVPDMFGDTLTGKAPNKTLLPYPVLNSPDHKILDIIRRPCIVTTGLLTNDSDGPIYVNCWPSVLTRCDRLSFFSQYFRFWRGSLVFTYKFYTSPLISARIVLRVKWETYSSATGLNDMISRIVTVRGSHTESVQVPFLYPFGWQRTDAAGGEYTPVIQMDLDTPISTGGDLAGGIWYDIFVHAGPDFEFDSLRSAGSVPVEAKPGFTISDAHMFVDSLSQGDELMFATNTRTRYRKQTYTTVESIARRYDVQWDYSSLYPIPITQPDGMGQYANADSLSLMFPFFRGEMDFLLQVQNASTATCLTLHHPRDSDPSLDRAVPIEWSIADGVVRIDPRYTSTLEARIPTVTSIDWVCTYDVVNNYVNGGFYYYLPEPDLISTGGTVTMAPFIKKISNQSSFAFELPPPYYTIWPSQSPPSSHRGGKLRLVNAPNIRGARFVSVSDRADSDVLQVQEGCLEEAAC